MKKSLIIFGALAGLAAAGASFAAVRSNPAETKADPTLTTGSLIAKLDNRGKWSEDSAKLCALLEDDSDHSDWTNLVTISSSQVLYKLDYSVTFTPTHLTLYRLNPDATVGTKDKKWNATSQLNFREATYVKDYWDPSAEQCIQWTLSADVKSNQVPSFNTKATLSNININSGGNPEVSGVVTLVAGEEFKVYSGDGVWSGYWGAPTELNNDAFFTGGNKEYRDDLNPNIVCKTAGTYDFFFDTETKKIWLSRKDIVADDWADYFLANVGCDATGVELPSGWSAVSARYATLTSDAKDYICDSNADEHGTDVEHALARYEIAIAQHPTLTKFIVNSSGIARAGLVLPSAPTLNGQSNASITAVATVGVSGAIAAAGFIFLKKRRSIL